MLSELQNSLGNDVLIGLAQAGGAVALCAAVVALCS
jgi:putative ABC transport system permease protein